MATSRPSLDKEALRVKYGQERDKRLRPDGNAQYLPLEGLLSHNPADPYTVVTARAPVTDHVTFAFVGGGFAGLLTGAHLVEAGISDVRIVEKAGDFGGTWYWNRYPGAQCDTASMVYLPLLEETGHVPSEKYAHAPEILQQCGRIADTYSLRDLALFHTEVTEVNWDAAARRWLLRTDRGDAFTADFVGFGTGPLHVPKLPGLEGIASFRGESFHTSRWDYGYTGGDPAGTPMEKLRDKRVAVIGTGATAIQCVSRLARDCGELCVFQRTPSSVDVRGNEPIDPDWFANVAEPGWQRRWRENFAANQAGGTVSEDFVQDGWTDIARRIRTKLHEHSDQERTPETVLAAYEDSDFEKMEEIRSRVDAIVKDPETAEHLKAWYRQLCKRPCFNDEYLQSFNRPNIRLVDTDGQGVERVTPRGVVARGVEYEVDCIIYASGFEVGTPWERRAGFDLTGRDGLKLSEVWSNGVRTLHGIHVHGFPNAFFIQTVQGANLISNVPHNLEEAALTTALIVKHAVENRFDTIEASQAAQDAWIALLLEGKGRLIGGPDCTPGYYNNEGQTDSARARLNVGYPEGASAFFKYIDGWRRSGRFEGLEFSSSAR